MGYPIFDTAVGRIGVYISYDRHFPEGWRALGSLAPRSCSTRRRPAAASPCTCGTWSSQAAAGQTEYFIGAINRVGVEPLGDDDFYGSTYFVNPRGQKVGEAASDTKDEYVVRLDLDMIEEVRQQWAFYRDRRPDAYGPLVEA